MEARRALHIFIIARSVNESANFFTNDGKGNEVRLGRYEYSPSGWVIYNSESTEVGRISYRELEERCLEGWQKGISRDSTFLKMLTEMFDKQAVCNTTVRRDLLDGFVRLAIPMNQPGVGSIDLVDEDGELVVRMNLMRISPDSFDIDVISFDGGYSKRVLAFDRGCRTLNQDVIGHTLAIDLKKVEK